ncbi:hypothetical protein [Reichenbachiella agariperforans]|uniref:Uncharacterized protein n=1 Tax=Reichenbachiella agariperforans TaxID=156994 RepID=A0A1M6RUD6_REIAG|nr:hypothetical protein [Reichenbachiella agariperforans]MBU2915005.1 hypothetical protein [Reichenbachiella agariperforans]SHK36142.1 hypothetical protein SAMN04488028_104298 [Reichenbachiella agariperforans]
MKSFKLIFSETISSISKGFSFPSESDSTHGSENINRHAVEVNEIPDTDSQNQIDMDNHHMQNTFNTMM